MHRRRTQDYVKVIKAIKKAAAAHGRNLNPASISTDFEIAAINAFKAEFPAIETKGCLFHLGQSLMKKLAAIGLKKSYEDDNFKSWVNSIFALALCPPEHIDDQWLRFLSDKPIVPRIDEFIKYFNDNYLRAQAEFPPSLWNHFYTVGRPKQTIIWKAGTIKSNSTWSLAIRIYSKLLNCFKEKKCWRVQNIIVLLMAISLSPGKNFMSPKTATMGHSRISTWRNT
jgi:hypothetical protein